MATMLKFLRNRNFELSLGNLHIFLSFLIVSGLVHFLISQEFFFNSIVTQFNFIHLTLASIAIALLIQQKLFDKIEKLQLLFLTLFAIKLLILPLTMVILSHYSLIFFGNFCFSLIFLTLLVSRRLLIHLTIISLIVSLIYSKILALLYPNQIISFANFFAENSVHLIASMIQILAIIILLYYKQNELEVKLDAIKNFSKVMAHEVFPSISLLETHLQIMQQKSFLDKEILSELLLKCHSTRSRINFIIDNVKSLNSNITGKYKNCSARQLLSETIAEYLAAKDQKAKINLIVHCDTEFYGSPKRIKKLFYNIIDNAFEHGGPKVKLEIIVSENNIILQDDGRGIESDDLEVIFEPFTSSDQNHLGIGLSLCKEIINNHGGEITCISLPRNHTTFIVKLPSK